MTTESAKEFQSKTDLSTCCDYGCDQGISCPARIAPYHPPLDVLRAGQWVAGVVLVTCMTGFAVWALK